MYFISMKHEEGRKFTTQFYICISTDGRVVSRQIWSNKYVNLLKSCRDTFYILYFSDG